ncbi:hypothetical protein A9Q84_19245 [Halobacteriovorax marinus]|uniref:Glycosyltransferase 2-like domain-containing protein n=1 Tax=Halobacteriovorax marinus TaxID=97084 RepID=A0A1Y5F2D4_9BACT|nr:hypothetical protein A9Q84_19245 [Halobacteriovorax marinus]
MIIYNSRERNLKKDIPHTLSITVPALNEEANLGATLEMLIQSSKNWKSVEIIVIDDGSTDKTSEIAYQYASKCDLRVIRHKTPFGRGYSINEGFTESKGDFLICFNGKKDTTQSQVEKILNKVNQAELIISYQDNTADRPLIRRVLSRLYTGIINLFFNKRLKYYNGSILLKQRCFKKLDIKTSSYAYETEMLLNLLECGTSYIEVPVIDIFEDDRSTRSLKIRNILGVVFTFLRMFFEIKILSNKTRQTN